MKDHVKALKRLSACNSAVQFASEFETLEQAWLACERADWMLWLIGKTVKSAPWTEERKPLLACALECAETVKHLWPESQKVTIEKAIAVLRLWIEGNAKVEEAMEARRNLRTAADAADAAADAAAADAAAAAAAAADTAAADADAAAADAAAAATADATAAAAYAQKKCAGIVRKHFPQVPIL